MHRCDDILHFREFCRKKRSLPNNHSKIRDAIVDIGGGSDWSVSQLQVCYSGRSSSGMSSQDGVQVNLFSK